MNISELKSLDIKGKSVLIIGAPASGKTYACSLIADGDHTIIHTDDYQQYGYEQSMYVALDDVKASPSPTIVEGVQGYRMLRKGVELNCYYPDIVIELVASDQTIQRIYSQDRDPSKLKHLQSFAKTQAKILGDYQRMNNSRKPLWVTIENNH